MNIFDDPGQDRIITEIYAWVSRDPATGLEGICGLMIGDMPFQCATSSRANAERMRPSVEHAARISNKKFTLVRFAVRENLEEIRV